MTHVLSGTPGTGSSTTSAETRSRRSNPRASATSAPALLPFRASRATAGCDEGKTPVQKSGEWGHRSPGDHVVSQTVLFGPAADHVDPVVDPEFGHSQSEEGEPPQERFEQRHLQVRAKDGQGQPGKAGPTSDIHHRSSLFDQRGQRHGVEHVPLPQPPSLAGAQQTPVDTSTCQYIYILAYRLELVSEQCPDRVLVHQDLGRTTTRRRGSSPSDSLTRPAAATASCTILRSNGFIGASRTASPVSTTSLTASRASS